MIRAIRQLGDPVLKARAVPVRPGEFGGEALARLVGDMRETLARSNGVGLAAPQVGESVRLILAGSFASERYPDRPDVPVFPLVNPRIVAASEGREAAWEGCLSFLEFRVRVSRHVAVTVEYHDPDGTPRRLEAAGFFARVLQHELDHLDGILTLDLAASPEDVEAAH